MAIQKRENLSVKKVKECIENLKETFKMEIYIFCSELEIPTREIFNFQSISVWEGIIKRRTKNRTYEYEVLQVKGLKGTQDGRGIYFTLKTFNKNTLSPEELEYVKSRINKLVMAFNAYKMAQEIERIAGKL